MDSDNSDKVWLNINTPKGRARIPVSKDLATQLSTDPSALRQFLQRIHFADDASPMSSTEATNQRAASPSPLASSLGTSTGSHVVSTISPMASSSSTATSTGSLVVSTISPMASSSSTATSTGSLVVSTISPMASSSSTATSITDATDDDDEDDEGTDASGVWKRVATLLLIEEYKIRSKYVEKGQLTKKAMWGEIASTLRSKGYSFSSDQVAGRWKTLVRAYKKVKDNNKKSGRGRKNFQYEDELDDVFGNDPVVSPSIILSSGKNDMDSSSEEIELTRKVTEVTKKEKKQRSKSAVIEVVETVREMMKAQERRHQQRMEMFGTLLKMQSVSSSSKSRTVLPGKRRREPTPPSGGSDSDF